MAEAGIARLLTGQWRQAAALLAACLALWAVFLALALGIGGEAMHGLMQLMMPMSAQWSVASAGMVFVMWSVMMAAMMLPSALPMALTFAALDRGQETGGNRLVGFVAAYLAVWCGFSLGATLLQWWLQGLGLISAAGASTSAWLAGGLLVAAGAMQFSRLKQACLAKCRTPLGFLMTEWREGAAGAARMGLRHGVFCLGCCGALMLLPFVAGTMNIWWMALLTAIVAVEKLAPRAVRFSQVLGLTLLAGGVGVLGAQVLA